MKKRIILISISFVLVILSIFLLFTKLNNKVNVVDFSNNETIIKKENPITNNKDTITIEDKGDNKKTDTKEDSKESNNTINNNLNTTNNNPTPKIPTTPTITYSCPDGFELQGTECYQTFAATHICANGMSSIDSGCISFSEGIESPDETCPNGYYGITMISFGNPNKYYCYPIHEISFTCPDGYNLNNNMCTKVIPANRN